MALSTISVHRTVHKQRRPRSACGQACAQCYDENYSAKPSCQPLDNRLKTTHRQQHRDSLLGRTGNGQPITGKALPKFWLGVLWLTTVGFAGIVDGPDCSGLPAGSGLSTTMGKRDDPVEGWWLAIPPERRVAILDAPRSRVDGLDETPPATPRMDSSARWLGRISGQQPADGYAIRPRPRGRRARPLESLVRGAFALLPQPTRGRVPDRPRARPCMPPSRGPGPYVRNGMGATPPVNLVGPGPESLRPGPVRRNVSRSTPAALPVPTCGVGAGHGRQ